MSTDPSLDDYWQAVTSQEILLAKHPEDFPLGPWRKGQVAFNVLYTMRPDLADTIRGTLIDPFYKDEIPMPFELYLYEHWE